MVKQKVGFGWVQHDGYAFAAFSALSAPKFGQPHRDTCVTVMLHEGDHGVPALAELVGLAAVATTVVGDLFTPPPAISLGFDVAARAPVPKTAVHKNGDAVVGEHEVGLPRKIHGL